MTDKAWWLSNKGYLVTEMFIEGKWMTIGYHRYVMEQAIGRKLNRLEHVHHLDGNKLNNDISNLKIMTRSEHHGLHMKEKHKDGKIIKNLQEKRKLLSPEKRSEIARLGGYATKGIKKTKKL